MHRIFGQAGQARLSFVLVNNEIASFL